MKLEVVLVNKLGSRCAVPKCSAKATTVLREKPIGERVLAHAFCSSCAPKYEREGYLPDSDTGQMALNA